VWPVFVEMLHALLKHGRGVALIDDQEAVAKGPPKNNHSV
jgi:hypothetical protein